MRATWILIGTAILTSGLLGCVVNEPESPPRGVVVSGPPPAPVQESRPPAPSPSSSYITGYWHWTGMQYAWIPGHWETPPANQVWATPKVTALQNGQYVYESGGWKPASPSAGSRNALR